MIKPLMAAAALLIAGTVNAEPYAVCITNELDDTVITADIAFAAGQCHLARAIEDTQNVSALEYAHSWFLEARRLGSNQATQGLKDVEQKLESAGHAQG
ncbi:hypothetical protein ACIGCM_01150 [Pseudomonas sp. NPDC078700]|uniref:hypothetical protein n=1 Tax=Pseudomonas sp. NPDC078700 TaxID=3364424 RepID=UPI0037C5EE2A